VLFRSVRRRTAWRAWTFFGVTALANAVIVGLTRIGFFPVKIIAYTVYFNLEIVFLFFLALAGAFLPGRSPEATGAPPSPALPEPARSSAVPALSAGLALYLTLSWWGGYQLGDPDIWVGARARTYTDQAQAGLEDARATGARVALVDRIVPEDVVPYLLVPYNNISEVFPLVEPSVSFDSAGRQLFDVTASGTLRRVAFTPEAGGEAARLLEAGALGVVAATPELTERGVCVRAGANTATVGFTPPGPMTGALYVEMRYAASRPSVMSILADPTPRFTAGYYTGRTRFRVVNVEDGGPQTRVFSVDAERLDRLLVVIAPRGELCLEQLQLGRLVPRP
jgi:hypothetical protein